MNDARYEILESYVADSVSIIDYEWNHVYVNKAVADFLKIPKDKLVGLSKRDEKKITIKSSIVSKQKKRYVQIRVHDNGQGIQKAILQKIFDPFFTTKPKGKDSGVGLGLSISYGIIKVLVLYGFVWGVLFLFYKTIY